MNIFRALKNSFLRSIKGEEKFWKVFWLWGFLIYVGSFIIGLLAMIGSIALLESKSSLIYQFIAFLISLIMFFGGLIIIYVFPTILFLALSKCAPNINLFNNKTKKALIFFFRKIFPVIFMIFHLIYYVPIMVMGCAMFLSLAITFPPMQSLNKLYIFNVEMSTVMSFCIISSLCVPIFFTLYKYFRKPQS